jgi:hypothetical protein
LSKISANLSANARALRWAVYEVQIYNTFLTFIKKFSLQKHVTPPNRKAIVGSGVDFWRY